MNPHDFALLAREAYSAKPDIGDVDSASRAIVRQTAAGLVVAFPGTDNVACFVADLDMDLIDVPGLGEVHHGFYRSWDAISVDVLAAISGKPVTLVGHSLGAAIALMGAGIMTASGNPPAAVYAFEPPRVSTDLGIRTLLSKVPVHLYKNGLDIVPDLPPGWNHAGLLVHIGKPSLPIANVQDHAIDRVIAALV